MMHSSGLAAVALLMIAGVSLQAQESATRATSPTAVEETVYRTLFDGIALDTAVARQAKAIIADEMKAQMALDRSDPDVFNKRIRLNFVRDSTLRTLLHREADLQRFDRQSASIRPRGRARP